MPWRGTNIYERWDDAWSRGDGYYHANLGYLPPEEAWLEEQRRRRANLEQQALSITECKC